MWGFTNDYLVTTMLSMDKEDKETKNYEISFLTKSELERAEIVKLLNNHQLSIIGDGQSSKIRLAYPIKKEEFAYFSSLYFSAEPEKIKDLNHELRTNPGILRFSIVSRSTIKETEERSYREIFPTRERPSLVRQEIERVGPRFDSPQIAKKPQKTEALSNEALEKKLEEILK